MKCETFLEEMSSAPNSITPELEKHLLVCPSCKETYEAINELKLLRAPLSAKEVQGISKIKSQIKGSSVDLAANSSSFSMVYKAIAVLLVLAGTSVLYLTNTKQNKFSPDKPIAQEMAVSDFQEKILSDKKLTLQPNADSEVTCFAPGKYRISSDGIVINSGKAVLKISKHEKGYRIFTPLCQATLKDCLVECNVDNDSVTIKVIKGKLELIKNADNRSIQLTPGKEWKDQLSVKARSKVKTMVVSPIKEDLELKNEIKKTD